MSVSVLPNCTALSTVAELPGYAAAFEVTSKGSEVAQFFQAQPELPGVLITRQGRRVAALSQTQFLRVLSRPFGIELFYGRPVEAMVEAAASPMLVIPANFSIPAAVERCLARPPLEMYEPFLVEEASSALAHIVDFRMLLQASNQIVALRNEQMDRILSSVAEGLLTIGRDLTISPEYSRALEEMWERKDLAGQPVAEVLGHFLDLKTAEEAREYLQVLFNPRMIDRLIESVNPLREVRAVFPGKTPGAEKVKHFAVRFRRIKSQGQISQVLMRVEETTRQVLLAEELAQQSSRAEEQWQSMLQLCEADPEELSSFLASFDACVLEAAEWIQNNAAELTAEQRLSRIYRRVHGLKGEAGALRLRNFQQPLHRYEQTLEQARRLPELESTRPEALSSLAPGLNELMQLAVETRESIGRFQRLAGMLTRQSAAEAPVPQVDPLAAVGQTISEMAERVGKPVAFHSKVTLEEIPEAFRPLLREVLIQLARNSLVHGIEDAATRLHAQKPPVGNLQLALHAHVEEGFLEIVFQDDGAGLDAAKLRERLQARGYQAATDEEAFHAIFAPGFSTAEEVTLDAGRGIGLDLVRERVEAAGGRISVHSHPGLYCAFQILLPLPVAEPSFA